MKLKILFLFSIFFQSAIIRQVLSKPSRRHLPANMDTDSAITTRLIDLDNPEHQNFLRQFNISAAQLKIMRTAPNTSVDSKIQPPTDRKLADIKELRFQDIKNKITNAVNGNSMSYNSLPTHEMAAYPTCSHINVSTWELENNITINFAALLFSTERSHMYLDTAVLRLYKLNPIPDSGTTTKSSGACDDQPIESQIRVTISTLQHVRRNKRGKIREKKKRICNTIMLNISQTGWIEIDIKKAINIWEKAERQSHTANTNTNVSNINRLPVMVGWLIIEVHDEDERPLKAGQYFEPPKCSEAYPAIPWNFYQQYFTWPSAGLEKVPRSPRLDIKFIDYRSILFNRQIGSHQNHKNSYKHQNNNEESPSGLNQASSLVDLIGVEQGQRHRRRHEHHHRFNTDQDQNSSNESDNVGD